MPKRQLKINGKDAFIEWGISMDNQALSALMTPAGMKPSVTSKSRLEHGKRVLMDSERAKVDERDITLNFNLLADSEQEFFDRYSRFCQELATGQLNIETSFQPGIVYKCLYLSCTQFREYWRGIGMFTLRLNEPNPTDRTAV